MTWEWSTGEQPNDTRAPDTDTGRTIYRRLPQGAIETCLVAAA
jgi:hypothetical protein